MEKFIEVCDNFLDKKIEDGIEHLVLNTPLIKWVFNKDISNTNLSTDKNLYGFYHHFYDYLEPYTMDTKYAFYFLQVLYKLSFHLSFSVEKIFHARLFLQTPSPNPLISYSSIHTDLNFSHWVCLYYINNSNGDTVFFDDNGKELKKVSPKKGRVIFFDGSIKHTGSSSSSIRSLININFLGKKL